MNNLRISKEEPTIIRYDGLNGEGYDAGDEHYAYLAEWCFNCLLDYVERRKEK